MVMLGPSHTATERKIESMLGGRADYLLMQVVPEDIVGIESTVAILVQSITLAWSP